MFREALLKYKAEHPEMTLRQLAASLGIPHGSLWPMLTREDYSPTEKTILEILPRLGYRFERALPDYDPAADAAKGGKKKGNARGTRSGNDEHDGDCIPVVGRIDKSGRVILEDQGLISHPSDFVKRLPASELSSGPVRAYVREETVGKHKLCAIVLVRNVARARYPWFTGCQVLYAIGPDEIVLGEIKHLTDAGTLRWVLQPMGLLPLRPFWVRSVVGLVIGVLSSPPVPVNHDAELQ